MEQMKVNLVTWRLRQEFSQKHKNLEIERIKVKYREMGKINSNQHLKGVPKRDPGEYRKLVK